MKTSSAPDHLTVPIDGIVTTDRLAFAPAEPTLRQVEAELAMHLETAVESHREGDGVVRDPATIHQIACLQKALRLVGEK